MAWLAARTGKDPRELTASPMAPLTALPQAVRETADLAARTVSGDAAVREQRWPFKLCLPRILSTALASRVALPAVWP